MFIIIRLSKGSEHVALVVSALTDFSTEWFIIVDLSSSSPRGVEGGGDIPSSRWTVTGDGCLGEGGTKGSGLGVCVSTVE